MNAAPIQRAFAQVGWWFLLVMVVVLLTFLFNILGTITCAVLVGMMMGAMRQWKWQALPISAIFPLVVVALLRQAKAELSWQQTLRMSLVCLGIFWLTYLLTFALRCLERRDEPAGNRHRAPSMACPSADGRITTAADPGQPIHNLSLEDLQGAWIGEVAEPGAVPGRKRLEIHRNEIKLSIEDVRGEISFRARGTVKLERAAMPAIIAPPAESAACGDGAGI